MYILFFCQHFRSTVVLSNLAPWAPSHQLTSIVWRSSSSIMTLTTVGIWQQRLTGIMKTAQRGSLSAPESKLWQVCWSWTVDLSSALQMFWACHPLYVQQQVEWMNRICICLNFMGDKPWPIWQHQLPYLVRVTCQFWFPSIDNIYKK